MQTRRLRAAVCSSARSFSHSGCAKHRCRVSCIRPSSRSYGSLSNSSTPSSLAPVSSRSTSTSSKLPMSHELQRRSFAKMPRGFQKRRDPFDPTLRHDPHDDPDAGYQLLRDPRPQGAPRKSKAKKRRPMPSAWSDEQSWTEDYEHEQAPLPRKVAPVKAWTRGVPIESQAHEQLFNIASMPFIHSHVAVMPDVHYGIGATIGTVLPTVSAIPAAVMPDVHYGMGATIGTVLPTVSAIIPAAVGVDIGCGMCAVRTSLHSSQLPDNLRELRGLVENAIPHGRTHSGKSGVDRGSWRGNISRNVASMWGAELHEGYERIVAKHPKLSKSNSLEHLGTLGTGNHSIELCLDENDRVWLMLYSCGIGTGNHFIELCLDEHDRVWLMLHSGSDGIGTGNRFIELCLDEHDRVWPMLHSGSRGIGTGNHFIELCLDEHDRVWLMLHSGSRGIGNRIGMYFIELARRDMLRQNRDLPDKDLAYLTEGTQYFEDYVEGVEWAQKFARKNRELMMNAFIEAVRQAKGIPSDFDASLEAVNCHHNYVSWEHHFGKECIVTRKGAVNAAKGVMGIIPGSMGERSFIVRGKGNAHSFNSCSHGAGRLLSRTAAKKRFSLDQHKEAVKGVECRQDADVVDETPMVYKNIDDLMHAYTRRPGMLGIPSAVKGVECRQDADVVDETPMAYKNIDDVMRAQTDLVEVVYTLKQLMCVKG